jgi:hypothetical protein
MMSQYTEWQGTIKNSVGCQQLITDRFFYYDNPIVTQLESSTYNVPRQINISLF